MGVIKDRHGTYCARKTVPAKPTGLRAAVALELANGRAQQSHLKRSLGTKDLREANIRAKPVLAEFDRIIAKAKAKLARNDAPDVKRTSLNAAEIKRIAEYVYAKALADDETARFIGREGRKRLEAEGARLGITDPPFIPHEQWPERGIPVHVFEENRTEVADTLRLLRRDAALGDFSGVEDHMQEALWAFHVDVDKQSLAYTQLGTACLQTYLRALEDIQTRDEGKVVQTPELVLPGVTGATGAGGTILDALEGWKRHRARPQGTVSEASRSVAMFVQLHGNMAVVDIKRRHAVEYRRALLDVPRFRKGKLLTATLPEQAEWGRQHTDAPKITASTINKQIGAVQAVCLWASTNGLVPDDTQWPDAFSKLRLPVERSERTSFTVAELQLLFSTQLFTAHELPVGAQGAAGFWLPLLALFTGARQAELGSLTVSNVQMDAETKITLLYFVTKRAKGKRVKTEASERAVPVHPELIRLGLLDFVHARRQADGEDAWLFPSVAPDRGRAGIPAWSKWFGRYLRDAGVTDKAKVFHSFRHTVKDALRRGRADHEVREALIGHAQASSVSWGYGASAMLSRFGAAVLADAVNRRSKLPPRIASARNVTRTEVYEPA